MVDREHEESPAVVAAKTELYAAPLAEFVAVRKRLEGALKASGDKDGAKRVGALRKPNATAWGLNQVARREVEGVRALHEARAHAEKVQVAGDVDETRAAIAAYRGRLEHLVSRVEDVLRESGASPTKESLRGVREVLDAAATNAEARARILEGCLVDLPEGEEDEIAGLFFVPAGKPAPKPAPAAEKPEKKASAHAHAPKPASVVVDLARKRLRDEARRRLDETTHELKQARSREALARADLARAEQAVKSAAREVEAAEGRVEAAERAMRALEEKG